MIDLFFRSFRDDLLFIFLFFFVVIVCLLFVIGFVVVRFGGRWFMLFIIHH
jgi:hypothetical protein